LTEVETVSRRGTGRIDKRGERPGQTRSDLSLCDSEPRKITVGKYRRFDPQRGH
jgi:hypothetical protein